MSWSIFTRRSVGRRDSPRSPLLQAIGEEGDVGGVALPLRGQRPHGLGLVGVEREQGVHVGRVSPASAAMVTNSSLRLWNSSNIRCHAEEASSSPSRAHAVPPPRAPGTSRSGTTPDVTRTTSVVPEWDTLRSGTT